MKYFGIDYGAKRIGVALSDESGTLAFPHAVFENKRNTVEKLTELCRRESVAHIVVGHSLNYRGEENSIMRAAHTFVHELERATRLPISFEPEVLSTAEASRIAGETDMLDASAAAIILQSHIDRMKHNEA